MAAAPPLNPDFGQTLTKGVKYLKINKIDKDGEDFGSQLSAADNLILNYPDIGPTQYNILTTQEQDGCYLMGVIPVENTSSLNNVKNLDLNIFKAPVSKTLDQLEVAVWNPDNDGGLFVAGGNGGGYYDDATDLLDFNLANTPTSVTSSITVSNVVGSPIYLSVLIPETSVNAWVEGIPTNLSFGIVEVNDKIIIAKIFLKERYGDGHIKRLITVTIDRYLGSIDPSGLSNIVEDTRTDKYDIPFFFKQFWADRCEKFSPPVLKKKF